MDYQYEDAVAILRRTPATLTALLRGLPEAWTTSTEGPDTWSACDIVKHLLHGDEVDGWRWIDRTHTILEYGEQRHLDSLEWSDTSEEDQQLTLDQLLAAFEQARAKNLATLGELRITAEQLALKGIHPDLGTVTLSQVLAAWVVHDLNHIGQIVEVLSQQYAEAVGPGEPFSPSSPDPSLLTSFGATGILAGQAGAGSSGARLLCFPRKLTALPGDMTLDAL